MTVSTRRVWRASPLTLALVWVFAVVAAVGIPVLAHVVYSVSGKLWLSALLALLTVLFLLYAWRFGLYPSLRADDTEVVVRNPFRTARFPWEDITVVASGENGLLIGSEEAQSEAWCIQKSTSATRRERRTRSDDIVDELLDLLDEHEPAGADPERGWLIRRARPDESRRLTRMEHAASEAALGHVFPPDQHPYPTTEVTQRWRRLLRDRRVRVRVLERSGAPIGFVAFDEDTVLHLGVVPEEARRGYGSALLAHATAEMFAGGIAAAHLWVLVENHGARAFYRAAGWQDTEERRGCEFPPNPPELQLVRANPRAPRRRRLTG